MNFKFLHNFTRRLAQSPTLGTIVIYAILTIAFFYPVFQSKSSVLMDQAYVVAPMYSFFKTEVFQGHLPLWNPHTFAGLPFAADPAHPVFSPFNILFLIFEDIFMALSVQTIVFVTAAATGAYLLARSLKLSYYPSLFTGLLYGFSGSVFETAQDLNSLIGAALIPWALTAFVYQQKSQRFSKTLAAVFALQLITAHTQYAYYGLAVMTVLFLVNILKTTKLNYQNLLYFPLSIAVGLSLSAIQLLPSLELISQAQRQENFRVQDHLGIAPPEVLRFIMPKVYGAKAEGNSWGPGADLDSGYAGIGGFVSLSTFILIFFAVTKFRKPVLNKNFLKKHYLVVIFSLIAITALILSFGNQTPLYTFFYNFVPGFSFFRSTARILVVYSLALAVLAGIALNSKIMPKVPKILTSKQFIYPCLMLAGLLYLASLKFSHPITQLLDQIFLPPSYSAAKLNQLAKLLLQSVSLVFLGISAALLLIKFQKKQKQLLFWLGGALVVIELFLSVRGELVFIPHTQFAVNQAVTNFLETNLKDNQRLISTADTQPYFGIWPYYNHLITRNSNPEISLTDEELKSWQELSFLNNQLPANLNLIHSLNSAAGYVAIIPKTYRDYLQSDRLNSLDFRSFTNPKLDDFAVKYIITGFPSDTVAFEASTSTQYQKVFSQGKTKVYQNLSAKPITEFISQSSDQDTQALLTREDISNSNITINISAPEAGKLILRELNYPGWIAYLDGQEVPINTYQNLFRSVDIPKGTHHLKILYRPASLGWGVLISFSSVVVLFY